VPNVNVKHVIMRDKIYNVIKDLQRGNVNYSDAVDKLCDLHSVSSCYAVFDEEDNIVQLYQTEEKASKGMEEFKRSHEHTKFYVDTMQIN
jgi:hypothetical protein